MSVFKYFRFWIPVLIIGGLIVGSFLVPIVYPDFEESEHPYLRDSETSKIIARAPYSPSEMPPIGSDKLGRSQFLLLMDGAKYTLLSALAIALFRMIGGFISGLFYAFMPGWFRSGFKGLWDTFNFIPLAIIGFILLYPLQIQFEDGGLPSIKFLLIEIAVISIMVIPSLGMYVGQGMNDYLKHEFIVASRQMGASRFHLIRKHLLPHFSRHSVVMFSEQVSQTLVLLIQLGILHICLGGLRTDVFGFTDIPAYFSVTNEWAATISININQVFIRPYLVLSPLFFFAIAIYCVNEISSVLRIVLIGGNPVGMKQVSKKKKQLTKTGELEPEKEEFTLINNKADKAC
ncbi:ABC transporter permease subunit [Bacillus sp. 2205SS5-2]|uniref:ABC transporter permease subunit n=1 Tax=Bacillus sp. 2205SS5-2 TaxID=3109031 RepID=UPI003006B946